MVGVKMRIAVGGFQHETNTFAPSKADFAAFAQPDSWPALQRGAPLLTAFEGMNIPVAGFIAAASHARHELVPLVWCSATPSAHVTEDAFERISAMMIEDIFRAGRLDAVYLDLHGAMVTEHFDDGEGELLRRVREAVGPDVPVVASLDLHANVTPEMVEHADALIAYRTYPHVDMAVTGARVAAHLDAMFDGMPRQAKAMRKLDFLMPLTSQCTLTEPSAHIYALVEALDGKVIGNGRVGSVSVAGGFAPADIPGCGPAVIAYADTVAAAEEAVTRLADEIAASEKDFNEKLWSAADAVAYAIENAEAGEGPIVLADTQDNPGAGGNGDTIGILAELIAQEAPSAALGVLFDPESAAEAAAAGEGARVRLRLGAKTGGAPEEKPIEHEFEVVRITNGEFLATGPFYGGSRMSLGVTARLRTGGVEVVVASRKAQCADREMLRHTGIEPAALGILVVKSSVHFRADFGPMAKEVLIVESPGPNTANLSKLPYTKLRKGIRVMPMGKAFGE
ncbi:M81 family metallopeptidase [Parvibaculum sp.]|uniref:M81 family metallopeptidase n=1 Tax=Parvibaculum sp. TaxID=2024848 RepID=UPI002730F86A|nr:M81 family metallopeptidase [Parvibaculum sp.]MDP1628151.1 M81 family metallopeptidase [Parvibaculum sp.]MDP2151150.1 M81 family metallopeptidase [Parvibaculum sp.]MDP3330225.1 M81 family metallopeptidase [Parvibaculum sp.]